MLTNYIRVARPLLPCLLVLLLGSCQKEAKLSPAPPNVFYTLPQGNHPYDQDILQFYNTYHTYILYKFDSSDFNYNITAPLDATLSARPADTNYIAQAMAFLHANWFDAYPPAFLQKTLPFKILLSSNICYLSGQAWGIDTMNNAYSSYSGYNQVTFGLVMDSLLTLTSSQIDSTRGGLQRTYWQNAIRNFKIETPAAFDSITNYGTLNAFNLKQNGVIALHPNITYVDDFLDYVQMITSTNQTTIQNTWLSPGTDVNGVYAQKYNIITSYYKNNYGVDLQALGNK